MFGLISKSCRSINIVLIQFFKQQVNKFAQLVILVILVGSFPPSTLKATEHQCVSNSTKLLPWGKYNCQKSYYFLRRNANLVVRMDAELRVWISRWRAPRITPQGTGCLVCPWTRLSCLTPLKTCSLRLRTALFTRKRGKRTWGFFSSYSRINTDTEMDSVQKVRDFGALGPEWDVFIRSLLPGSGI